MQFLLFYFFSCFVTLYLGFGSTGFNSSVLLTFFVLFCCFFFVLVFGSLADPFATTLREVIEMLQNCPARFDAQLMQPS